ARCGLAVRVGPPGCHGAGADRRRRARRLDRLAGADRRAGAGGAPVTAALSPRGTLRARFEPQSGADMFRRLGVGARCCDLGDEGLYLAEELVAADQWFGGRDPMTLGVVVLALLIAQRQGSTCLPLAPSPRGHLRTLVNAIARLAGMPGEAPALMRAIGKLTGMPQFDSVVGTRDQRLPLIVDGGCLYTERARWLEDRVARRLAERLNATDTRSEAAAG